MRTSIDTDTVYAGKSCRPLVYGDRAEKVSKAGRVEDSVRAAFFADNTLGTVSPRRNGDEARSWWLIYTKGPIFNKDGRACELSARKEELSSRTESTSRCFFRLNEFRRLKINYRRVERDSLRYACFFISCDNVIAWLPADRIGRVIRRAIRQPVLNKARTRQALSSCHRHFLR